jgi:CDP-6-deoxy-D-xylo-4-hexulose-3-dehydrase
VRRIEYAGSVHDEQEVAACLEVLRGGATALRIGGTCARSKRAWQSSSPSAAA